MSPTTAPEPVQHRRIIDGPSRPCGWCGDPSMIERLIRHGESRKNKDGKVTVIAMPHYIPCCDKCDRHLPELEDPVTRRRREAGRAGAWKRKQERLL